MLDIKSLTAEALKHEHEAEKCRMLLDHAEQIVELSKSLAKVKAELEMERKRIETLKKE